MVPSGPSVGDEVCRPGPSSTDQRTFGSIPALGPRSPWNSRVGLRSGASEPFIIVSRLRSASFYNHALSICAASGFTPRVVQEANELFTVLSLVGVGLGVSLVPRSTALMRLPGVRFREVRLRESAWDIGLAWRRDSAELPLVQRFVATVSATKGSGSDRRSNPTAR